jgi:ribosomal protein L12E/L44/L45/RPP1/RPP2
MLDDKNLSVLTSLKTEMEAPVEVETASITWLNESGDISITWDDTNAERIKELVRLKMAEGYSFFTMRKVVIDRIQVKRKVGTKGINSLTNLVIDDATFEKLVKGIADRDVAEVIREGAGVLSKRRTNAPKPAMEAGERLKTPEQVMKSKQSVAVRPLRGG